jgi:hypothetical protein
MSTDNFKPERISDEFLRRLQDSHTLVEQWKDTERVLMVIEESWLIAGLGRPAAGAQPARLQESIQKHL